MRRAHRSFTRLACREERRATAMAKASSGSLRADSLVFIPGAWSAEEIGVRKRLGNCAEQLAGADALPEAALRAVVREVRAELVALGLPRDDNTATRESCGGAYVENSAPTPESRDACGHAGGPERVGLALDALAADSARAAPHDSVIIPRTGVGEVGPVGALGTVSDGGSMIFDQSTLKKTKKKKASPAPDPDDALLADAMALAESERVAAQRARIVLQDTDESLVSSGLSPDTITTAAPDTSVAFAPSQAAASTPAAASAGPGAERSGTPAEWLDGPTVSGGDLTLASWLEFVGCPELLPRLQEERLDAPDFWLLFSVSNDAQWDGWPSTFRQELSLFREFSGNLGDTLPWELFLQVRDALARAA